MRSFMISRRCCICVFLAVVCWVGGAAAVASDRFLVGVGGYEVCQQAGQVRPYSPDCEGDRVLSTGVLPEILPNVNAVSIWITRDWQPDWYSADEIERDIIGKGYTPVFLFYWFGDEISPLFVRQQRQRYQQDLERFVEFLRGIHGEKWVILNPEFNQNGIESDASFNDLLLSSIKTLRQLSNIKVSFCIGDFGDYSRIVDLHNWQSFDRSINEAIEAVDFISFQEMRAPTRNPSGHIRMTAERALAFSSYLHQTYEKPTFLAYIAISSLGVEGRQRQAHVYQRLLQLIPRFRKESGLIGLNSFHLTDIPWHQGYFNAGEAHFGLIDQQGKAKPGLRAFREISP